MWGSWSPNGGYGRRGGTPGLPFFYWLPVDCFFSLFTYHRTLNRHHCVKKSLIVCVYTIEAGDIYKLWWMRETHPPTTPGKVK